MDLSTITDPTQLKSLAYEQVVAIEQAQVNLKMIQQRLLQVQQQELDSIEAAGAAEAED